MDNIFAQYCMLIITAFTPIFWFFVCFFFVLLFFGFASIWDGEGLCVHVCGSVCVRVSVYIGEGLKEKKKIIRNFLMYCFYSPTPLLLYHFKF